MSTLISTVHAAMLNFSIISIMQAMLGLCLLSAVLVLFKPLLRGLARALMLALQPKLSKEEYLRRRQMRDALMLKRMLNAMEGAPSHAAELRAMAARA